MKKARHMKPAAKLLIIVAIVVAVLAALKFGAGYLPKGKGGKVKLDKQTAALIKGGTPVVKVGVVTWGGYAGGQYWNLGFDENKDSRYYTECKILVKFLVMDDFDASRAAWKNGSVDLMWGTADSFPTEAGALADENPKIVFQADWSRGGDAIVVRNGINSVSDLKGKTVAVAVGTPSHSFLIKTVSASNLKYTDIQVVEVPSAIDAAATFKAGQVDAAVVWSPDDSDCVKNVPGSKVLTSTKTATNIIADIFFAKESYIQSHQDELKCLVGGWLKGAAEVNASSDKKDEAAEILSKGLNIDKASALAAIDNTRLATYGDNLNFFGLDPAYTGVTGEDLYTEMFRMYSQTKRSDGTLVISGTVPPWRNIADPSIVASLDLPKDTAMTSAEPEKVFEPAKPADVSKPAIASKALTITFDTGSSQLDENAKAIIDMNFVSVAKSFGNARIRIEGNTDNVGDANSNLLLSQRRAEAVANYLIERYGFDRNRFMIMGNGQTKPIADNATADGRAMNRRTDFEIVE